MFKRRAVFIDRDGTVIEAIYRPNDDKKITAPYNPRELKFVPRVYPNLGRLKENEFLRILVTNQPDVAHGHMSEEDWTAIHKRVTDTLGFDDVFMCRHRTEDNCPFKKPSPLMLLAAADKWGIDLSKSWMIGDTNQDMQAGLDAGCRVILINREYNSSLRKGYDYNLGVNSFEEAVNKILDIK